MFTGHRQRIAQLEAVVAVMASNQRQFAEALKSLVESANDMATEKTITIDHAELLRLRAALNGVTLHLRDLMEHGFPRPPRKNCNADAGSAHQEWLEERWQSLAKAEDVLNDTEGLC
jgi:hypothetical protein